MSVAGLGQRGDRPGREMVASLVNGHNSEGLGTWSDTRSGGRRWEGPQSFVAGCCKAARIDMGVGQAHPRLDSQDRDPRTVKAQPADSNTCDTGPDKRTSHLAHVLTGLPRVPLWHFPWHISFMES